MKKLTLLGDLTPAQFLRDYWHKKPLLIRQAIPNFNPLLSREDFFSLAANDEVESRLVTHFDRRWSLEHGPFSELPSLAKKNWTLLVQGVNLHVEAADKLMRQFSFIPEARLDDLMISYATDRGGVGPHFDSYDVFLLQAYGKRQWRIGAQQDLTLKDGMPLKILKHFTPEKEFVLEPGDMLYLPPQYAHDGIALGECMTYSVGFRAPSYQEIGEAFLQFMAESIELPGRYADPDLAYSTHPAEISKAMLDRVQKQLQKIAFTREDITIFLGEYLSEPKPNIFFDAPSPALSFSRFTIKAKKLGIALDAKTRMLHRGKRIFINGESFDVDRKDRQALVDLANDRQLFSKQIVTASQDVLEAFYEWYRAGWLAVSE
ncbi:MAG: cupin domain-containing protein [Burkholderiales bacterium]|nr:cupin domain-containing protein [Burkholderiales bacterium]